MNISGLSKAAVLKALFDASYPPRAFFSGVQIPRSITMEEAEAILATGQTSFGVLQHHDMYIDISGDEVDTLRYNTLHDEKAEKVIERLRAS